MRLGAIAGYYVAGVSPFLDAPKEQDAVLADGDPALTHEERTELVVARDPFAVPRTHPRGHRGGDGRAMKENPCNAAKVLKQSPEGAAIAEELSHLRASLNLSLGKVALATGLPVSSISNWERGIRAVKAEAYVRLRTHYRQLGAPGAPKMAISAKKGAAR